MKTILLAACLLGSMPPAGPGPDHNKATTTISATGKGLPPRHLAEPQARLMAERAAQVIAVRNLAAKVQGLPVPGHGSASAPLPAEMARLVRGYRYLPSRHLPDGSVEVTVELVVPRYYPELIALRQRAYRAEEDLCKARAVLRAHKSSPRGEIAELQREVSRLAKELAAIRIEIAELRAATQ